MNKLNHLGNELVELKRELTQSHTSIVLKSLNQLADQLLTQKMIDDVTFSYLKDSTQTVQQFQSYCLTQSQFCLDQESLLKIYDKKRLELVNYLNQSVEAYQLTSKSFLKEEEVVIVKSFSFDRDMACQFFGIDERFCENLYGRKRFIERFVVLRYKKILSEFIQNYPLEKVPFKIDRTPVFFDETTEAYTIEFLIKFKLEVLEDLEEKNFVNNVHQLMRDLIRYVNRSMGLNVPVCKENRATQQRPTPTTLSNGLKEPHHSSEEVKATPTHSLRKGSNLPSTEKNLEQKSMANESSTSSKITISEPHDNQKGLDQTQPNLVDNPTDLEQSFNLDEVETVEIDEKVISDIENDLDLDLEHLEDEIEIDWNTTAHPLL